MSPSNPDSTSSRPSLLQWAQPTEKSSTSEAAVTEPDLRSQFYDAAAAMTPIVAVEDASGAVYLLPAGGGGDSRLAFAKPKRLAGGAGRLRKAVQALEQLDRLDTERPKTYVELGANTGVRVVSALLHHRFARALAVEPNPDQYKLLCANVALNDLSNRVTAVLGVPYPRPEPLVLKRKGSWGGFKSLTPEAAESALARGRAVQVPQATVDDLVGRGAVAEHEEIGLLWLGLREKPLEALRAAETLERVVPIVVELDPRTFVEADDFSDVVAFLSDRYPRFVDLSVATHDIVVADSSLIGSLAARYAEAGDVKTAQLILMAD